MKVHCVKYSEFFPVFDSQNELQLRMAWANGDGMQTAQRQRASPAVFILTHNRQKKSLTEIQLFVLHYHVTLTDPLVCMPYFFAPHLWYLFIDKKTFILLIFIQPKACTHSLKPEKKRIKHDKKNTRKNYSMKLRGWDRVRQQINFRLLSNANTWTYNTR